jgi:hypothetical protein
MGVFHLLLWTEPYFSKIYLTFTGRYNYMICSFIRKLDIVFPLIFHDDDTDG